MFCWLHGLVDTWCGCGPASFPDLSNWPSRMYHSVASLEPFVRTHD